MQPVAPDIETVDPASGRALEGFFGRSFAYTALWAAQRGVATLLTPIVTRLLGPAHFGIVVSCLALTQLLVAVFELGLGSAAQRAFAQQGDVGARKVITLSLLVALVFVAVVSAFGPLWAPALKLGNYSGAVALVALWAGCEAVTFNVMAVLRSRDQLGRFALVSLIQTTLTEALAVVLVVLIAHTATKYVLGELIGQVVAVSAALCFVPPTIMRMVDRAAVREVLRFAAPLMPVAVFGFAIANSDRLVVNALLGHAAAARYAIANNLGSVAALIMYSLFGTWLPRVFSMRDGDVAHVLTRSRNALYMLLIPFTLGVSVAAPLLLRLWAPASYRPDQLQLAVVLVVASAYPFAGTSTSGLILMRAGRTGRAAAVSTAAGAVNIGLNFALVPWLGIDGSAIATLATYLGMHLISVVASREFCALPCMSRRLLAEIGITMGLAFAVTTTPVTASTLVLRGAVGCVCGLMMAAVFRQLNRRAQGGRTGLLASWVEARLSS